MHSYTSCFPTPADNAMVNGFLPDRGFGYGVDGSNPNTSSSLTVGKSPSPAVSAHCSWKSTAEMKEEDGFYEKLNKLNESAGLSLLFNFRHTSLDLLEFYKYVTDRGGYHEITKDGKWEDVASNVNRKNQVQLTPTQLQRLYATILYPYEQTYHYRCAMKHNKTPKMHDIPLESRHLNSFTGKRKHDDGLYGTQHHFSYGETPSKKTEHVHGFRKLSPVCMVEEKRLVLETPDEVKETRKDPRVPLGSRNCYQMFIKMERDRLKRIHEDALSTQLRDMNEAWKHLSNDDKGPYIEASKKDKERFVREMAAYKEHKRKEQNQLQTTAKRVIKFSSPKLIDFASPSREAAGGSHVSSCQDAKNRKVVDFIKTRSMQFDVDYHAILQPDEGHEFAGVPNESMVQMAGVDEDCKTK